MIGIGDLKHRVMLQGMSNTVGEGGQKTRTYPMIANVWAKIKPNQMPVKTRADRVEFVASYQITIPYSPDYLSARRILSGGRQFIVQSIINLNEGDRFLVFQCEEKAA